MSGVRTISIRIAGAFLVLAMLGFTSLKAQSPSEDAKAFASAQNAMKTGDYRAAEQIYQQFLSRHPGNVAAEVNLGLAYYLDHQYAESSTHLVNALRTNPNLFPALMVGGVDFMKLGDTHRAVALLRRARQLRPADEYVNHNLASAEYLAEDYPDSCADYSHYLSLPGRNKDTLSWYGLGEVSLILAQRASERLGELPPTNPYRLRLLARIYVDQQEWSLALTRLKELEAQPKWRTRARLEIGDAELLHGDFASAATEFRKALTSRPNSARAHYGLGVSLLLTGQVKPALQALRQAVSDPWLFAHPETLSSQLAGRKLLIQQIEGAKNGSALVDAYLMAAAQGTPNAAFHEAYQQAVQQAYRTNEERLQRLLRSAPSQQRLMKLAADFLEEGDVDTAAETLDHVEGGGQLASQRILLARVSVDQENALKAVRLLLPLWKANESPEIDWRISTLFRRVAELALNQVLMVAPDSVDAHLLKAQVDNAHSHTGAAIREFELAATLAPNQAEAYFRLGEALWRAARFRQAISALREGLRLDNHNAAAYYEVGDSYVSLGQAPEALPFLVEALKQNPEFVAAAKDLGMIYLHQGNVRRSLAVLNQVAVLDKDGSIHYLLFRVYSSLDNKTEAAACLKRFQELKAASQNRALFNAEVAARQERETGVSGH